MDIPTTEYDDKFLRKGIKIFRLVALNMFGMPKNSQKISLGFLLSIWYCIMWDKIMFRYGYIGVYKKFYQK